MSEQLSFAAKAKVKLSKYDEQGNLVDVEEAVVELTKEEAQAIWLSQQKV